MNGYKAFFGNATIEVYAESWHKAKVEAIAKLKVPKSKRHMVSVVLCEKDNNPVTHSTTEIRGIAMIFSNEIVMIDYSKPLVERAKSRKMFTGPYRWFPVDTVKFKDKGRGFYTSRKTMDMDDKGSPFRLRIEHANEHIRDRTYYYRTSGDDEFFPIVALLPSGKGFIPGWTMGNGMCGQIECTVIADAGDAAYQAHELANIAAENEEIERRREGL